MEISVIKSQNLSDMYETRYVIIDKSTGEMLDDAQGYGYKTVQKAYAAWNYKHRDRSKDAEKAAARKRVVAWMKEHKDFVRLMDDCAFDIAKGSGDPNEKFNAAFVRNLLKECDLSVDFTANDLLKVWRDR